MISSIYIGYFSEGFSRADSLESPSSVELASQPSLYKGMNLPGHMYFCTLIVELLEVYPTVTLIRFKEKALTDR